MINIQKDNQFHAGKTTTLCQLPAVIRAFRSINLDYSCCQGGASLTQNLNDCLILLGAEKTRG